MRALDLTCLAHLAGHLAKLSLAAPLALAACAIMPPAKLPAATATGTATTTAITMPTATVTASAIATGTEAAGSPNEDAETQLLERIDSLDDELDQRPQMPGRRRLAIAPVAFDLEALPVAHIGEPLGLGSSPLPHKDEIASEILVDQFHRNGAYREVRLGFKEATLGEVIVGDWNIKNESFHRTSGTLNFSNCAPYNNPRYWATRWTSLRRMGDGRAEYTVADGWMDTVGCKVFVERRTTVAAVPLLPGELLYAFRDCKGTEGDNGACGDDATLTLLFPAAPIVVGGGLGGKVHGLNSAFGVAFLPLHRGGGASLFVRLDEQDLQSFRDGFGGAPPKPWSDPSFAGLAGFGLGVEVVQGVGDTEPIAIAYLARDSAIERADSAR